MRAQGFSALCAGWLLLILTAAPAFSQTLGDVAKKEEERRKQAPASGKVYTNKDLGAAPPASSPPPAAPAPGSSTPDAATPKDGDKAPGDKAQGDKQADAGVKKDQAYWQGRMKKLKEAVDRDQVLADAMQSRINALTADFVNRDDPAQRSVVERDRQRALAELDNLKKQIAADQKAIVDLEEEARRAGVPPGWLR